MIEIKDNGEKLVEIKKLCPDFVIDLDPERPAYLRETVAKMVLKARNYLPKNITFIIGDAWRSREIQKGVHKDFYKMFKKHHPEWSDARIKKEVNKYAAPYQGKYISGHMTGGAVDLRLWRNGRKVPMKSSKLAYQENALSNQPELPKYLRKNRKILFAILKKAGLSNASKEYWHWSYGDLGWAKRNHKKETIYGPIDKLKKEERCQKKNQIKL
jgi:D-alanyl-D-alanine dipeptidase